MPFPQLTCALLIAAVASAPRAALGQRDIAPGDPALQPARIRIGTDTIAVLVAPRDSTFHLSSTLYRTIAHLDADGGIFRETQRYESHEPSRPGMTIDTLDVDALTLRPLRSIYAGADSRQELTFDALQVRGTVVVRDSAARDVHAVADRPFFHAMMVEAFIAAFPVAAGAPLMIPAINPPVATIRPTIFQVDSVTTIATASGPVRALVAHVGNASTFFWVAADDGRLLRMHWTFPNGMSVWKLPQHDVPFLTP